VRPVPIALRSRAAAVDRAKLRALIRHGLDREGVPPEFGLGVVLAGDRLVRELNRTWRGKDHTTDVLSFPLEDPPPLPPEARAMAPPLVGEVVISLPRCLEQARERGVAPGEELARLVVHGLLHCLGHDHERPRERARMAPRERALRRGARRLGVEGLLGAPTRGATAPTRRRRSG
jgi:probable rRNA maturation factor